MTDRYVSAVLALCISATALTGRAEADKSADRLGSALANVTEAPTADNRSGHDHTIVANPLGPLIGVLATSQGVDAISANVRYQRAFTERVGLTVVPEFGYVDIVSFGYYVVGVKVGPRISLSRTRLNGWYAYPMGLLGWSWTRQGGAHVQSAAVVGTGVELGYAWHWRRFVVELGGGGYYSALVGFSSSFESADADGPHTAPPIKPMLNVSLGYGW